MNFITPERAGLSSRDLLAFYQELDAHNLSTHAVMMSRGDALFTECYYAPFHKDFKHRMYSVSKSFVAVAVGFCLQDGLLRLSDHLLDFFEDYVKAGKVKVQHNSSIEDMLKMQTTIEGSMNWFKVVEDDRTAVYFDAPAVKHPGAIFSYDSSATYMLGVIVERVTGKPFLEYLKDKALREIGFSEDAYCLQCPGGNSWGDSGVMCTATDLLLFARFVLNKGTWQGKRYLNAEFLEKAVSALGCTNIYGFFDHDTSYGYLFWGSPKGCFAMNGMGCQVALCDPVHDLVFVINSDNQGNPHGYQQLFEPFYRHVFDKLTPNGQSLPEDPEAQAELAAYLADRKLFFLPGATQNPWSERVAGKVFECDENAMGLKWFRLDFAGDVGTFTYENAQGEKSFVFGFGHNEFGKFPEEGYSDLVGTVYEPGHYYDAAFSADWPVENNLRIRVQIIDKYFGNMGILIGFVDENTVSLRMEKKAEAFLNEYRGIANGKARE